MVMGLMRKALFIATGGLSGLVLKDPAKAEKPRATKATSKQRTQKQAKAKRPAPQAAKRSAAKAARPAAGKRAGEAMPKASAAAMPKAAGKASAKAATSARSKATKRAAPKAAKRSAARSARKPMPQAVTQAASAPAQEASNGTIHELERLAEMFGAGALNTDEFAVAKARILGQGGASTPFESVEANVAAARRLAELAEQDNGVAAASIRHD